MLHKIRLHTIKNYCEQEYEIEDSKNKKKGLKFLENKAEAWMNEILPLLISTGFLKYPLELKKIQLVYTDFFFQF